MTKRRVYIHSPAYDHHHDQMLAAVTFRRVPEERWDDYFVRFDHRVGQSLLANSFNCGWQDYLSFNCNPKPENGGPFDYFLLLASDVEPADGFLHTMVEELEAGGWDALSAVVAIKDDRGMTSTAVGQISNRWTESRKLTMTEVDQLPETFGVEECMQFLEWRPGNCFEKLLAHPEPKWQCDLCLCANTGCLLIKTADWCWEFPGFEIRDQFYEWYKRNEADPGRWLPPRSMADKKPQFPEHVELSKARTPRKCACVPEDWNFSRWMARMGKRVGATSKVRTKHWGVAAFGNDSVWGGEKFDHGWDGNRDVIGREPVRLDQLGAQFVRRLPGNAIQGNERLGTAEGLMFDCPKCRGIKAPFGGQVGGHPIICWFVPNVERNGYARVRPGCWMPMGTGLDDLSLDSVVTVEGGCGWCGRIENGRVL